MFYDFEVFKYDWLVVLIDPFNREEKIIVNDKQQLEEYYNSHLNNIWIGYNSRSYDQYILKGILCGFDPYKISKHIIEDKKPGYSFSNIFNKIPLNNYDLINKMYGLKQLEGFMGNDIRETEVDFKLNRKLTNEELQQTIKYCRHEVEQTMEVFLQKKNNFDAHIDLIKTFKLPLSYIGKTQAQLSAIIIGCQRQEHDEDEEWDIQLIDTLRIEKYKYVVDWFMDSNNYNENMRLDTLVCGIPHTFGLGGIHGAPDKPIYKKGCLIHVDVTSYYPSLMIRYNLLTRNAKDPSIFKQIYDKRIQLKAEGKKKEQEPYKIILNATFGICNDKYSLAYDPRQAKNVCINGQLLLLDLIEHLEGHCELIQSNTDGLIIQIPDTDEAFNKIDDICYEWEKRSGMHLGFDNIVEIYQKDVNNYIFKYEDGELEQKGAYVKELNNLDYDLPIINEAMVNFMINKIPIEDTINNCNELIKFQKIVKISGNYKFGYHNGKILNDKTYRVFASNDFKDTFVGKQKENSKAIEKFANTPHHCFIDNSDVKNKVIPNKLDKEWYIELAKKRLEQFGIDTKEEGDLINGFI